MGMQLNRSNIEQDYAESTMNELLGLYGYEKVSSSDTQNLNLDKYTGKRADGSDVSADDAPPDDDASICSEESSTERFLNTHRPRRLSNGETILAAQHRSLVSALSKSRDDSEEDSCPAGTAITCSWCQKAGLKSYTLKTPTGTKSFCSEVCFTQCRRASFKKNKVCDWCKHVRHTVNYVDFQDGEQQLQFCGTKCLNQYKMSIFCKETQEHLQQIAQNGGTEDSATDRDSDREILITPELWLHGEKAKHKQKEDRSRSDKDHKDVSDKFSSILTHSLNKHRLGKSLDISKPESVSRQPLIDRIKSETTDKSRKRQRHNSETLPNANPSHELHPMSGAPHQIPNHLTQFLHPAAMASMAPWLQQAHLMGVMPPGMTPYGPFGPFFYPGMMPPFTGNPLVPENIVNSTLNHPPGNRQSSSTPGGQTLSPHSEMSSRSVTPIGMQRNGTPSSSQTSPNGNRRMSSLFPVGFPPMYTGQNSGNFQPSLPQHALAGATTPTGTPPVTVLIPFPMMFPVPVPIPIPIPMTYDQLKKAFGTPTEENRGSNLVDPVCKGSIVKDQPDRMSLPLQRNQHYDRDLKRDTLSVELPHTEIRSRSRNSCPDLSVINGKHLDASFSTMSPYKRSVTPETSDSIDLSTKRFKYERQFSESSNEVMDLSSKDSGDKKNKDKHNNSLDNKDINSVSLDNEEEVEDLKMTRIHIVTPPAQLPLNQPLPLPPIEQKYSSRRGLILDAPSVPKQRRSPSPDRRVYVRNVPRDIMEATRRRCHRMRIRTK
ncbi:hypothetical protein ACJMK2_027919 [Sinanodonta woodiana]|uniref:Sine oculis-binding protein homolog n=1 Tax=Sinanodonta woodiana TaxID=1069815 RepID=A0ABD3X8Z6_SINWO